MGIFQMTKLELMRLLAKHGESDLRTVEAVYNCLVAVVTAKLRIDDQCELPGIGKLERYERKGFASVNPRNRQPVVVAPVKRVRFKPAAQLKREIKE